MRRPPRRAILLGDDPGALRRDLEAWFPKALLTEDARGLAQAMAAVVASIAGPADHLNLPLDLRGGDLAQSVWKALADVPAGRTASYAEIARAIGRPRAARAVAHVLAANPLAIVVPCHRVVRPDGGPSGY